jgi:hypothetical protein
MPTAVGMLTDPSDRTEHFRPLDTSKRALDLIFDYDFLISTRSLEVTKNWKNLNLREQVKKVILNNERMATLD